MVVIGSVTRAARRLVEGPRQLQSGSGVVVDFLVNVPSAIAVEQGLKASHLSDNPQAIMASLNEAFAGANTRIVVLSVTTVVLVDSGAPDNLMEGGASDSAASGSVVVVGLLVSFAILISCVAATYVFKQTGALAYVFKQAEPWRGEADEVVDVEMDNAFSCSKVADAALPGPGDRWSDADADGNETWKVDVEDRQSDANDEASCGGPIEIARV